MYLETVLWMVGRIKVLDEKVISQIAPFFVIKFRPYTLFRTTNMMEPLTRRFQISIAIDPGRGKG